LQRYRPARKGHISHLERRYGLDQQAALRGDAGQQVWSEWAIVACDLDAVAARAR
jgi:hypothetical protein